MQDLLALVSLSEHDCIMWYLLAVSLSSFESYQCIELVSLSLLPRCHRVEPQYLTLSMLALATVSLTDISALALAAV